ncbi:response regulator transcription factor [Pseudomonas sp. NA-150]|uniref:response regulator transcription factor n=1 Tax=Pseudomonas sp. NA-150 TaxID=3367525 RepID=UPI0037CAEA61
MSLNPVISIVDDEEAVRVATDSLVRSSGYDTYIFPSAEAFLASDQLSTSDCLITDVQMPGMNGLELQRVIVKSGIKLPIIFMTAFPEKSIQARAKSEGAHCFLSKPFDGQTMINCIERALGQSEE